MLRDFRFHKSDNAPSNAKISNNGSTETPIHIARTHMRSTKISFSNGSSDVKPSNKHLETSFNENNGM